MNSDEFNGSKDNLPVPPSEFHFLISGNPNLNVSDYFEIGSACAETIKAILNRNGLDIGNFRAVLDFGCGVGRVIRHFQHLKGIKLYGSDINPAFIEWCKANLPFAEFELNEARPPLIYNSGIFDLVYAFSVFTHLPEPFQTLWFQELSRVMIPGGYLVMTTHGEAYAQHILSQDDREKFQSGQLIVYNEQEVGKPLSYGQCNAFHPVGFVKEKIANGHPFEFVDYMKGEVIDAGRGVIGQDVYLLRKP
jgi:SAM-dependent methyltransferase